MLSGVENQNLCETGSWDLSLPRIPPRSRLVCLEPIGVGTPEVESLTGYIARLSEAHSVPTSVLFTQEIVPLVNRSYLLDDQAQPIEQSLTAIFRNKRHSLNGTGSIAFDWVKALEQLTLRKNLRYLTLLTWADVLGNKSLLRPARAWCPACYEEWRINRNTIYEPLLWALTVVEICLHHSSKLEDTCHHCGHQQSILSSYSRPGYCSRCLKWLGSIESHFIQPEAQSLKNDPTDYQVWSAKNMGELLASAPLLPAPPAKETIALAIQLCLEKTENLGLFASLINKHRSMISHWRLGHNIPVVQTLCQICHLMDASLLDFITKPKNFFETKFNAVSLAEKLVVNLPTAQLDQFNLISAALKENPPPSPKEVAYRLGFKNSSLLARAYPHLNLKLKGRYESWINSQGINRRQKKQKVEGHIIKDALLSALLEIPPPSICEVGRRLGYAGPKSIRIRFPDLCLKLIKKRKTFEAALIKELRRKLRAVLKENPPPPITVVLMRPGYKAELMRRHAANLCCAISARHAEYKKARLVRLKASLESALKEDPPPPVKGFAKRENVSISHLYNNFPDLCYKIAERSATHKKEKSEKRLQKLENEIRRGCLRLYARGTRPARDNIHEQLSVPNCLNFKKFNQLFLKIRAEIELCA